MGKAYPERFYTEIVGHSTGSAEAIVPFVLELFQISSMIDVGCGTGAWVKRFLDAGVDAAGVDGDYVEASQLVIDATRFDTADLSDPEVLGGLSRRFGRRDLALSLEVAEHLPAASAGAFVAALVSLAPAVCFSAAVPGQGGRFHQNEQWPSYWVELFREHGYEVCDVLRWRFWNDDRVAYWYSQNILLFVHPEHPALPHLKTLDPFGGAPPPVVHPRQLAATIDSRPIVAPEPPSIAMKLKRAIAKRVKG